MPGAGSGDATAAAAGHDNAAIAAIVAAAIAQYQATTVPARQLPSVPRFGYDPADSNGAASWFQQLESLFRLQNVTEEEKCALAVNALDGPTFKKVARALLPDAIEKLGDFKKLRDTMVGLFDFSVSLFARRYSALNLEWKGPEHETIAEYGARIKDLASAFTGVKDAEMETLMLMLGMKSPALEGFRTRVLNQLNKKADTPLDECLQIMNAALQTDREQKLPTVPSVNYVKNAAPKEHVGHHAKKGGMKDGSSSKHRRRSTSGSSGASSNASSRRGPCHSCGGNHRRSQCKYRESECYKCGEMGHIQIICKAKNASSKKPTVNVRTVRVNPALDDGSISCGTHYRINSVNVGPASSATAGMPTSNAPRVNAVKAGSSCGTSASTRSNAPVGLDDSTSSDTPLFRRGDHVSFYNSMDGEMQPGLIVDICNGLYELRYGDYNQRWALVKYDDVCPYDPEIHVGSSAALAATSKQLHVKARGRSSYADATRAKSRG